MKLEPLTRLAAAILFIGVRSTFAAEWVVEGRAVGAGDGDTITVMVDPKTQHKVRIAGIDAPEKGQAFGERSKQSLSALVFQKQVEARCPKKDRYGREVCAVYVARRDVGLEQIRTGMAWHYKAYQHEQLTQERLVYRDEEDAAREAKRGERRSSWLQQGLSFSSTVDSWTAPAGKMSIRFLTSRFAYENLTLGARSRSAHDPVPTVDDRRRRQAQSVVQSNSIAAAINAVFDPSRQRQLGQRPRTQDLRVTR